MTFRVCNIPFSNIGVFVSKFRVQFFLEMADRGRNLLLRHSTEAEIQSLQLRFDEITANIPTARASLHLPGIGHSFWQTANANISNDFQREQYIVANYDQISPTGGQIIQQSDLQLQLRSFIFNVQSYLALTVPLYSIDDSFNYEIGYIDDQPMVKIPVYYHGLPQTWQSGQPMSNHGVRRWHGTRTNVLAAILTGGLRTSPLSHGVIGTWLTGDARLAVHWNQNCLDEFPTAVLQLWVDHQSINCSQAVRAGHISRGCAEPDTGCDLANIIIEAVHLRIPTMRHQAWQLQFRANLYETILTLAPPDLANQIFRECFILTSWRLCYRGVSGCLSPTFGGPFESAYPIAINLSIICTQILWALQITSPRRRIEHFALIPRDAIPDRLALYLESAYPNILQFFRGLPCVVINNQETWRSDIRLQVQRWAVSQYSYSPQFEDSL